MGEYDPVEGCKVGGSRGRVAGSRAVLCRIGNMSGRLALGALAGINAVMTSRAGAWVYWNGSVCTARALMEKRTQERFISSGVGRRMAIVAGIALILRDMDR